MAAVFCEAVRGSRLRLALRPLTGQTTDSPVQGDGTDHVSPCPQSAGAAIQARADPPSAGVIERPSGHV